MMRWIMLLLPAIACAQSANWPQFRGPDGSAIAAADAAPPIEFGASAKLLWKVDFPIGHSSPIVWGQRVFLTSFDPVAKKLELVCVSASKGSIEWRRAAPAREIEETHVVSNPATASAVVDADRVYAYFSSYGVMAFRHDGASAWTLPLAMPKTHHGSGASPILAGDLVILNHDAMQGGYLLAVDRRTGKQIWKTEYPTERGRVESYSTPMVRGDQLLLHRAGVIEAYRIADGAKIWSLAENTSGASTPAADRDTIFVSTWNVLGEEDQRPSLPDYATLVARYDKNKDGAISADEFPEDLRDTMRPGLEAIPHSQNFISFKNVDRNKDGILQPSEWDAYRTRIEGMMQDHGLLAIRLADGKPTVAWRENTSIPEVPSPLLYRGQLLLVKNGGVVTCLDAASGKLIYRARVGAPGAYYASPVAADGRIYLASSEGIVIVIAAGDKLDVLARNDLGEDIVATPAIAGKAIYIRTLHHLFAFSSQ